MYCIQCGKNMPDGSAFCAHCGKKQEGQQVQQRPVQAPPYMEHPPVRQPVRQPRVQYTPPVRGPARPPGTGRGWKAAMLCSLGAAVVAFSVFAALTLLTPAPDAAAMWDGAGVMAADEVFGSYTAPAAPSSDSATTDGMALIGAWEAEIDGTYVGFEFFGDGTARYVEDGNEAYYYFSIRDDVIVFEDEAGETAELEFSLYRDGAEYLTLGIDGEKFNFVRADGLMK